jgi:hypothetical protein
MIKKSIQRIHGIKEGAEKQTKSIRKLFNEIIAESFSDLGKNMDIQVKEAYRTNTRPGKELYKSNYN